MQNLVGFETSDAKQFVVDSMPAFLMRRLLPCMPLLRCMPFTSLVVFNTSGYNSDERCTRTIKQAVNFYDTFKVRCPAGIFFSDALFHSIIKAGVDAVQTSRVDQWYELFCDATAKIYADMKELKIILKFDHGS